MPGSYSVTVTDANACTTSASAVISQPLAGLTATATPVSVSCFAGNNGAVTLVASGGTAPYSFLWSNAETTQNIIALPTGSYSVTITDNQSCSVTAIASVSQPTAALSATTSVTNVGCNGGNTGSINLIVTGGTTAYSFNWSDAVSSQNRTAISAGTYSVTISDANACSTTTTASVTEPAILTATTTPTDVHLLWRQQWCSNFNRNWRKRSLYLLMEWRCLHIKHNKPDG